MGELNLYTLGVYLHNAKYFLRDGDIKRAKELINKAYDMVEKQKEDEDRGLAPRPLYRTMLKPKKSKRDGRRRRSRK